MIYTIKYTETYAEWYDIEAESEEEAKEELEYLIQEGEVDGPEECIDSEYTVENIRK